MNLYNNNKTLQRNRSPQIAITTSVKTNLKAMKQAVLKYDAHTRALGVADPSILQSPEEGDHEKNSGHGERDSADAIYKSTSLVTTGVRHLNEIKVETIKTSDIKVILATHPAPQSK